MMPTGESFKIEGVTFIPNHDIPEREMHFNFPASAERKWRSLRVTVVRRPGALPEHYWCGGPVEALIRAAMLLGNGAAEVTVMEGGLGPRLVHISARPDTPPS
jgi:hypothetical protein